MTKMIQPRVLRSLRTSPRRRFAMGLPAHGLGGTRTGRESWPLPPRSPDRDEDTATMVRFAEPRE